ncbi:FAD-binding domain-containing protein [Tothia fuscella]|uniref:FAD-binding domain-containing protein n=1 Tax=Tothia fuscella TaxID=1048955 RepID=A0A9P4NUL9_9PEZI|nr:FAD-binding domain-containing protein [Tothia fuscella]
MRVSTVLLSVCLYNALVVLAQDFRPASPVPPTGFQPATPLTPPTAAARAACKAIPAGKDWPSDLQWGALNTAVRGRLLKPAAPAAACHRGQPGYSTASCSAIESGWKNGDWHVDHPTSNMWQNHNNYSCMPSSNQCSTSGYPIYVVAAKEASDVKAAVDFARIFNVRLNIKSTGHDFLGRSVQPNSLSIWTHGLKSMRWFNSSFSPKGCKAPINGPAVTVGSGSQWKDIYATAEGMGLSFVGGKFSSVSVGGFLANGGHGLLSAKYGLGADMVLEIELVTADGEIITANECQNTDYFWAMRGGGGSTYGVVLSYTIQGLRLGPMAKYSGTVNGWPQIAYLHSQWPKIAMAGGAGYITGYPGRGDAVRWSVNMPNSTSVQLRAIVDPIVNGLKGRSVATAQNGSSEVENGLSENLKPHIVAQNEAAATFAGMGANKILTSWLWSARDVASPSLLQALKGAFADSDSQLYNDATMGVGTHKPPYIRGGGNAVNPAFRTAIMRPAAELQWDGVDRAKLARRQQDALRYGAALKSLNPSGGTYANEADPASPDWQHAFWGQNYERLFAIKNKVDPQGVFYCRSCVGSELFVDRAGVLCRK